MPKNQSIALVRLPTREKLSLLLRRQQEAESRDFLATLRAERTALRSARASNEVADDFMLMLETRKVLIINDESKADLAQFVTDKILSQASVDAVIASAG